MPRPAALLLDVALVALVVATAGILATGGGELLAAGRVIRFHSASRPLLAFCALYAIRAYLAPKGWPGQWAARAVRAVENRLIDVGPARARAALGAVLAAATILKLLNAWFHPGFFSGDDVEIQEMTFARLFHWEWRAWELRSAFFPIAFIYPVQALLVSLEVTEPQVLVFGGRLVVVAASTIAIALLACIARWQYGSTTAVMAALAFAFSRLHVTFGSTELPRPVSTLFVVAAYGLLVRSPSYAPAVAAGACLGIAAAIRFSEAIFIVPALLMLAIDRQLTRAVAVAASAAVVALTIQYLSDALYWHDPFFSLQHIVDYTLVKRLSTRGYQPATYYLTHFWEWTNAAVIFAAVVGARFAWRPAMWMLLPLALLSALPHKEARYVIPLLPFLALLAAVGLREIIRRTARGEWFPRHTPAVGAATLVALVLAVIFESAGMNFRKSDDAVRLARLLGRRGDIHGLAVQQIWRMGAHLYLPVGLPLRDIDDESLSRPEQLASVVGAPDIDWAAVLQANCAQTRCEDTLAQTGYARVDVHSGSENTYAVFTRRRLLSTPVDAASESGVSSRCERRMPSRPPARGLRGR